MLNRLKDGTWVVDYSTLSTYLLCQKKCQLRYIRDLTPIRPAVPLAFGTAIHVGLAALHEEKALDEAIEIMVKLAPLNLPVTENDDVQRNLDAAILLLRRYAAFYQYDPYVTMRGKDNKPFVEVNHTIYLSDDPPIMYAMKIDRIAVHKATNNIWIFENKTTGGSPARTSDSVRPNHQITGYVAGASDIIGKRVVGAVLNALWTAPDPVKEKRKIEDLFVRTQTFRQDEHIQDWFDDYSTAARELIRRHERNDIFVKSAPIACTMYSGCEYHELCATSEDPTIMRGKYETRQWELTAGS